MTKDQVMTYVAAILTTALETEPSPFPESMAYLAMGSDLSKWQGIKSLMVASDLITTEGYSIALTSKGRALAQQCAEALAH